MSNLTVPWIAGSRRPSQTDPDPAITARGLLRFFAYEVHTGLLQAITYFDLCMIPKAPRR